MNQLFLFLSLSLLFSSLFFSFLLSSFTSFLIKKGEKWMKIPGQPIKFSFVFRISFERFFFVHLFFVFTLEIRKRKKEREKKERKEREKRGFLFSFLLLRWRSLLRGIRYFLSINKIEKKSVRWKRERERKKKNRE